MALVSISVVHAGNEQQPSGEYGLHLFFTETEFVDVLTFKTDQETGVLTGHMYVPDDFEGYISNFKQIGLKITFDLFVPKNLSRPTDLIFHYTGTFHSKNLKQLIGFVTIKGHKDFVASYIAIKRK